LEELSFPAYIGCPERLELLGKSDSSDLFEEVDRNPGRLEFLEESDSSELFEEVDRNPERLEFLEKSDSSELFEEAGKLSSLLLRLW
jgi:hypothetical protein